MPIRWLLVLLESGDEPDSAVLDGELDDAVEAMRAFRATPSSWSR